VARPDALSVVELLQDRLPVRVHVIAELLLRLVIRRNGERRNLTLGDLRSTPNRRAIQGFGHRTLREDALGLGQRLHWKSYRAEVQAEPSPQNSLPGHCADEPGPKTDEPTAQVPLPAVTISSKLLQTQAATAPPLPEDCVEAPWSLMNVFRHNPAIQNHREGRGESPTRLQRASRWHSLQ